MFESLSDRLQGVFTRMHKKGRLTEKDVDEALREVRMALLEADVNFKVVKNLVARIKERAIGVDVLESLTPDQQVVKIVNDELVHMLGGEDGRGNTLDLGGVIPSVIMLVGLQGAGKTTLAAKLGLFLRKQGHRPLLVAADVYRPAAIAQLQSLGKQLDLPVFTQGNEVAPAEICVNAIKQAKLKARDIVILDTAGRLHIDEVMMAEVAEIQQRVHPQETLFVADSMTGQEAVNVAKQFNDSVALSGLVLTKVDGDARGGAALSIREVTGVPIKFMSVGEKPDALEPFYPDRLASRILGMGDILTLIEKAQQQIDVKQAEEMRDKLRKADYTLEDFRQQMVQIRGMGSLSSLVEMIPGLSRLARDPKMAEALDEKQTKRIEAIICSMTMQERFNPHMIDGKRRRRIAKGSGTSAQEVNQLLRQFEETRKMMKKMAKGKFKLPGMPGFPGMPNMFG